MLKIYLTITTIIILSVFIGIILGITIKEAYGMEVSATVKPNKCNVCLELCKK